MRTMNTASLTSLGAALLVLAGCGDYIPGEPVIGDLNIYDAVRIEIQDVDGLTRDLVMEGGRFELALEEGPGTFRSDLEISGVDLEVTGTYAFENDQLVFSDGPFEDDDLVLERAYDVLLGEGVIVIASATGVFDVDNDGAKEVIDMEVSLERRD